MNHDATVSQMIDEADEAAIGLLGRDGELQFVRLAAAYNEQQRLLRGKTAEIARLREALQWYADKNRYEFYPSAEGHWRCDMDFDKGDRAEGALKEISDA